MSEKIVQLNEEVIKGQLKELVRGSVEETLNELLEQEAERLTQAARYERSEARQGYRSGHYDRNLTTTSGDVTLHVPRLKGVSFETAIIERYRRRESSVEEALIEMYLAGVSVRRVEDITEALWGSKVSPATISELNKKAYVHIEDWRNRPLQGGRYPYVYVDGIYLRRNWGGEYENVAILVAIAVNEDGYREVLGAAEGMKEDKASWVNFFQWLKGRGLTGVQLIVGDKCLGMLEAVWEVFPDAKYQRCNHGQVVVEADGELGGLKLLGQLVGDIDIQNVVLVGVGVDLKVLVPLEIHAHIVLVQLIAAVHQGGEGKGAVGDGAGGLILEMALHHHQLVTVLYVQGGGGVFAGGVLVLIQQLHGVKSHQEVVVVNAVADGQRDGRGTGLRGVRGLGGAGGLGGLAGGGGRRGAAASVAVVPAAARGQGQSQHTGQNQGQNLFLFHTMIASSK